MIFLLKEIFHISRYKNSIHDNKQTHRKFTNAWRTEFAYGTNYKALRPENVWDAAQRVYAGYPDLLEAARKTIFN